MKTVSSILQSAQFTVSVILTVSVICTGCASTPVSISVRSIPGDNYEVSVEFVLDK